MDDKGNNPGVRSEMKPEMNNPNCHCVSIGYWVGLESNGEKYSE